MAKVWNSCGQVCGCVIPTTCMLAFLPFLWLPLLAPSNEESTSSDVYQHVLSLAGLPSSVKTLSPAFIISDFLTAKYL